MLYEKNGWRLQAIETKSCKGAAPDRASRSSSGHNLAGQVTATHLFQSPLLRTDEPPTTQEACLSQTRRQVTFDFYGYVNNDDGSTTLTFGVTNGHRRALDAIVFPSNGWTRQSPAKNTRYTGDAGTYRVQWIPRNTRRQEAFRLRPQGNWFRNGASDRFTVTVTDFDPTKLFAAWVQSRNRW